MCGGGVMYNIFLLFRFLYLYIWLSFLDVSFPPLYLLLHRVHGSLNRSTLPSLVVEYSSQPVGSTHDLSTPKHAAI